MPRNEPALPAGDWRTVLGVGRNATLADCKAARRVLAAKLHPDHGGDKESMARVNEAFDHAAVNLVEEN